MSALINEKPIINWKHEDNTFSQISAGLKYNNRTALSGNNKAFFRALPLQIYRKEIVTDTVVTNPRTSGRIFDFERPGGTITTSVDDCLGIKNTEIITNNSVDAGCNSNTEKCKVFLSVEDNARRRVRSSGMIRKKYNSANTPSYFTNTKQYLESRNLSHKTNSNFHVASGDVTSTPGTTGALQNIYASNMGEKCKKEVLVDPGSFKYKWIDSETSYDVIVPAGSYDITDLNNLLHSVMTENGHYYIVPPTNHKEFLINLKYNQVSKHIDVEAIGANAESTATFNVPKDIDTGEDIWDNDVIFSSLLVDEMIRPQLLLDNTTPTELNTKMGFTGPAEESIPGIRKGDQIKITEPITSGQTSFAPKRKQIYYKPNNPGFSTQGAVSSSDLITRRKYNTITTVAGSMRSAYGNHTAASMAYGVPAYGYTKKDKIGYPMKQTPTFSKHSDIMKKCTVRKFANAI